MSGFVSGKGAAIDVGAAPGGWTVQLAEQFELTVAVDPAEMHPSVAELPNVVHVQRKSEDSLEEVSAALAGRQVDLLCCDMNKHPLGILEILGPLLGTLRPGGLLCLTLKFRGRGRDKAHSERMMAEALGADFEDMQYLWLLANTQHERTLVARRRVATAAVAAGNS